MGKTHCEIKTTDSWADFGKEPVGIFGATCVLAQVGWCSCLSVVAHACVGPILYMNVNAHCLWRMNLSLPNTPTTGLCLQWWTARHLRGTSWCWGLGKTPVIKHPKFCLPICWCRIICDHVYCTVIELNWIERLQIKVCVRAEVKHRGRRVAREISEWGSVTGTSMWTVWMPVDCQAGIAVLIKLVVFICFEGMCCIY